MLDLEKIEYQGIIESVNCVCVEGFMYPHRSMCTYVHVHIEVRGQPWVSLLRPHTVLFSRQGLSLTCNSPSRLDLLVSAPSDPSVSTFPAFHTTMPGFF